MSALVKLSSLAIGALVGGLGGFALARHLDEFIPPVTPPDNDPPMDTEACKCGGDGCCGECTCHEDVEEEDPTPIPASAHPSLKNDPVPATNPSFMPNPLNIQMVPRNEPAESEDDTGDGDEDPTAGVDETEDTAVAMAAADVGEGNIFGAADKKPDEDGGEV